MATQATNKYIAEYLRHLCDERQVSRHTLDAYGRDLQQFHTFVVGQFNGNTWKWCDLERAHIGAFAGHLHDRQLAPRSIARKLSAVRSFLKFLCREGDAKHNPARRVRGPRVGRSLPHHLSVEEVSQSIERAGNGGNGTALRDVALIELLYSSGLRLSEVAGLNVEDIDFEAATVRVRGKGNRERVVPIGGKALDTVHAYLEDRARQQEEKYEQEREREVRAAIQVA